MIENEHPKTEEQRIEDLARERGWHSANLDKRLAALERRFSGLEQRLYTLESYASRLSGEFNLHAADPIGHGEGSGEHWEPTR